MFFPTEFFFLFQILSIVLEIRIFFLNNNVLQKTNNKFIQSLKEVRSYYGFEVG